MASSGSGTGTAVSSTPTIAVANNGDITYVQVERFLKLGVALPTAHDTAIDQEDVNAICDYINNEVNEVVRNLGFKMPVTHLASKTWMEFTKVLGAAGWTLHALNSQDTEEGNTRGNRLLDEYNDRLMKLINSGGDLLNADRDTLSSGVRSTALPVTASDKEKALSAMRFSQKARALDLINSEIIRDQAPSDWQAAIRGF